MENIEKIIFKWKFFDWDKWILKKIFDIKRHSRVVKAVLLKLIIISSFILFKLKEKNKIKIEFFKTI